jgi:sortase A
MNRQSMARPLSGFERTLLACGVALLLIYAGARVYTVVFSRLELHRYWQAQLTKSDGKSKNPDFRLWSKQRIAGYQASLKSQLALPLGVLKIPSINLEVPLLEGTDDLTLNRAVGHIEGTAAPGSLGNIGVAGHRDGFFRGLKDIQTGDVIELINQNRTDRYVVDEILIVSPEETSVLSDRSRPSLTLVTCYPFYYVGSAPLRYIVHASSTAAGQPENGRRTEFPMGRNPWV